AGYGISLAAGSFVGQQDANNIGSRGDVRTNNDTINGVVGYINIANGIVTGNGYSTLPAPTAGDPIDPIFIDPAKVLYSSDPAIPFDVSHKQYGQPALTFPDIPAIPPTPAGSSDYFYRASGNATPPARHSKNL